MVREPKNYITIGYCRKSPSSETEEKRKELLQKMVNNLRLNDLCEKVFVSSTCTSNSLLSRRDRTPTNKAKNLMKQLRFVEGDMQDLLMFVKTCTLSVRLIVLDYAGFFTDPNDIKDFINNAKSIEEIVVDHGHKLEVLNRHQAKNINVLAKFNCRKGAVKRSTL